MKAAVTLKKNHEFQRMYRRGASAVSPLLVIYCRKNRLDRNRLGITVSVKLGKAVTRNRVRRRFREIYRLNRHLLSPGWDIVLVARGRAVEASYQELDKCFVRLCGKLSLMQKNP